MRFTNEKKKIVVDAVGVDALIFSICALLPDSIVMIAP